MLAHTRQHGQRVHEPIARELRPLDKRLPQGDMADTNKQKRPGRPRRPGKNTSGLSVGRIDFKPGPDAEDRLRRIFTILIKRAGDDPPIPRRDSSPDDDGEMEG